MQIYLIVLDLMLYFKVHLTCSIRKVTLNSLNLKQPTSILDLQNDNGKKAFREDKSKMNKKEACLQMRPLETEDGVSSHRYRSQGHTNLYLIF